MPVSSIEHTADIRLRAWGNTFQRALLDLSNRMLAMMYGESIHPELFLSSKVEYDTDENCVIRTLNDIIYRSESASLALKIRRITICNNSVIWEAAGERADRMEGGSVLVKAATYDRINVSRKPAVIEVTLDV
ncbi:MAG: archease [Thermoplasmatales archaeon]